MKVISLQSNGNEYDPFKLLVIFLRTANLTYGGPPRSPDAYAEPDAPIFCKWFGRGAG
jgi:hypothetical protein